MDNFSDVVKKTLASKKIDMQSFAAKMGFSVQYIYDLLSGRNGRRWNADSMNKACSILEIEVRFFDK